MVAVGTRLGPYEILESIGKGGMGEVYRARDTRLGRDVALKLVNRDLNDDSEIRRRFHGAAIALSRLSHPNVATVFDVGTHGGVDFLVMELIPGVSLAERLGRDPLPIAELMPLALQLAEGLAAAHEAGIVHRDLKSANVSVTPEGRLKVLDFGLARAPESPQSIEHWNTVTLPGTLVGTLAYLAPEVLSGAPADARADVYALGVVLFEMATGRHPFPAGNAIELLNSVANRTAPSARSLRPDLPDGFEDVIRSAMHRAPAYLVAIAFGAMGEREPAWEWMERAVKERALWLVFLDVDPRFDSLRDDPRFPELRRRVGVKTGDDHVA